MSADFDPVDVDDEDWDDLGSEDCDSWDDCDEDFNSEDDPDSCWDNDSCDESMDGDHESGFRDAGWGTDESYGFHGGDD